MRLRPALLALAVGIAGMALLLAWPSLHAGLLQIGRLLAAGDLSGVREHLRGFGPWAPVVAFALIQLQAVAAPLPSFPVIYANGLLFGTLWGGLLPGPVCSSRPRSASGWPVSGGAPWSSAS